MRQTRGLIFFLLLLCLASIGRAAETFPPAPKDYFTDYAGVTRGGTAARINDQLRQFEQATSSQVVVAVFPKLDSNRPYDDYSVRLFNAWQIGQKGKDNGVGLFVYVADHKVFICTGKGMEGPLPDATCFAIIQNDITPLFKQGDFDGGLTNGVNAILAATHGEYKGTGTTVNQRQQQQGGDFTTGIVWIVIILIFFVIPVIRSMRGGYDSYDRFGRRRSNWYWTGGFGSGFGGSSGGGFSGGGGGGGGGFSGGGGSSGGGGAGGSW